MTTQPQFQFDTTGVFHVMPGHPLHRFMAVNQITWSDLSPFERGYVEAMLTGSDGKCLMIQPARNEWTWAVDLDKARPVAFSDLAPDALARIMDDCERFCANPAIRALLPKGAPENHSCMGRAFWNERTDRAQLQGHSYFAGMAVAEDLTTLKNAARDRPPLTPYLGDDGKVHLRTS